MGWTTPRTWATNEVVTSANMNTHVRDNLAFLGTPPRCSVSNSAAVAVTTATATILNANTEAYDNDTMHSTVSNTSRITINTAGVYLFVGRINYQPNASGDRSISFKIDGTTQIDGPANPAATSGISTICCFSSFLSLTATQYVECQAYQTSGGNLNATLVEFSAVLLAVP